jgi:hypothetical protein
MRAGQPLVKGGEWYTISELMSAPVPLLRSSLLPESVLDPDGSPRTPLYSGHLQGIQL